MTRFSDPRLQEHYERCRQYGADPAGPFYMSGRPRTGAAHRCSYWDGRSGATESFYARAKGTLGHAAYAAGRDDRKADAKAGHPCPRPEMKGLGAPVYPLWQPPA